MNIVYIHGANATPASFNFIRGHMKEHEGTALSYDSRDGFKRNCQTMLDAISELDDVFFVTHSLGGVYAVHLAAAMADRVKGAVTISAPYGGSDAAKMLRWLSVPGYDQLFRDIMPLSPPMVFAREADVLHPWTNIVTTSGRSPFMMLPNDGVVTHASMRAKKNIDLINIAENHFEVVMNLEVVSIIKSSIGRTLSSVQMTKTGITAGACA